MRTLFLISLISWMPLSVMAADKTLATTEYVAGQIDAKFGSGSEVVEMQGNYNVTGSLVVPTPPLPSAN